MTKNNFYSLSLPERLKQAGIYDQFSQAVKSGNVSNMTSLLKQIDYPQDAANATANIFLNSPSAFILKRTT